MFVHTCPWLVPDCPPLPLNSPSLFSPPNGPPQFTLQLSKTTSQIRYIVWYTWVFFPPSSHYNEKKASVFIYLLASYLKMHYNNSPDAELYYFFRRFFLVSYNFNSYVQASQRVLFYFCSSLLCFCTVLQPRWLAVIYWMPDAISAKVFLPMKI
jgi:hypothetical protein